MRFRKNSKLSESSRRWLSRHAKDPFVHKAKAEGWRSRAAYKLLSLHQKYALFKGAKRVIDLGAAPGSWSEVALHLTHGQAKILALDLLDLAPLAGVTFFKVIF